MTKPSLHPFTWWLWAIGLAVAIVRFDSTWFTLSCLGVVMVVVYGLREDAPWAKSFDWTLKLAAWIFLGKKESPFTRLGDAIYYTRC
jgi:energy-coupling factor transport system permease protein